MYVNEGVYVAQGAHTWVWGGDARYGQALVSARRSLLHHASLRGIWVNHLMDYSIFRIE
jgi:hypothetical protein